MNNTPKRAIRVSKIFLVSFALAGIISLITGVILLFIFRPYRYTDKAAEIYLELAPSLTFIPSPTNEIPITDKMREESDEFERKHPDIAEGRARRLRMLGMGSYAPVAMTPRYVDRQAVEAKTGKSLVFGGTAEFFQYCDSNDSPVTWTPSNIETSIQLREDYLIERIKRILFFTMLSTFTLAYIVQFIKKHKIRLVID